MSTNLSPPPPPPPRRKAEAGALCGQLRPSHGLTLRPTFTLRALLVLATTTLSSHYDLTSTLGILRILTNMYVHIASVLKSFVSLQK
jgi:hypothetical protein